MKRINELEVENLPFRFFKMKGELSGNTLELLRGWFDGEWEFLDFCTKNFDVTKIMKNII